MLNNSRRRMRKTNVFLKICMSTARRLEKARSHQVDVRLAMSENINENYGRRE
jgi:hypothetical protein